MSAAEDRRSEKAAFAARLEQLATVTQVTLAAVLRIVDARQEGALTEPQLASLDAVRQDLTRAVEAIDQWADDERADDDIDLAGLRRRLTSILGTIDRAASGGGGGQEPS